MEETNQPWAIGHIKLVEDKTADPLEVTVDIKLKRRWLIKGYSWNIYDENDKIRWDGYPGLHGWCPNRRWTLFMVKFVLKAKYGV